VRSYSSYYIVFHLLIENPVVGVESDLESSSDSELLQIDTRAYPAGYAYASVAQRSSGRSEIGVLLVTLTEDSSVKEHVL